MLGEAKVLNQKRVPAPAVLASGCARAAKIPPLGTTAEGMYNGSILAMPRRINDEVEEREIIRKGLSSLI